MSVEQEFHDVIWRAANDFFRVERAVAEARDLAYAVLNDTVTEDTRRYMADQWLDTFGRSPLKERGPS